MSVFLLLEKKNYSQISDISLFFASFFIFLQSSYTADRQLAAIVGEGRAPLNPKSEKLLKGREKYKINFGAFEIVTY